MKRVLFAAVAAMLLLTVAVPVASGAGFDQAEGCVDDPDEGEDPRGEVLRFCAAVTSGTASFAIDVEQVLDPNADPTWTSGDTDWRVELETTGDADPDFSVTYANRDGFGASVTVLNLDSYDIPCEGTATFEVSRYVMAGLDTTACFGTNEFRATSTFAFWDRDVAISFDDSPAVTPAASLPAPLGGATPPPPPPPPEGDPSVVQAFRLEGPTRLETAVSISQYQWPNGARDVYLSRSDEFADSISSGSLTNGPILLVPQCGAVPDTVLNEIDRLNPTNVVALGGTAAICDDVLNVALAAAQR